MEPQGMEPQEDEPTTHSPNPHDLTPFEERRANRNMALLSLAHRAGGTEEMRRMSDFLRRNRQLPAKEPTEPSSYGDTEEDIEEIEGINYAFFLDAWNRGGAEALKTALRILRHERNPDNPDEPLFLRLPPVENLDDEDGLDEGEDHEENG